MRKYKLSVSDIYSRKNLDDLEANMRLAWDGAIQAFCHAYNLEYFDVDSIGCHLAFKNWFSTFIRINSCLEDISERSRLKTRAEKA